MITKAPRVNVTRRCCAVNRHGENNAAQVIFSPPFLFQSFHWLNFNRLNSFDRTFESKESIDWCTARHTLNKVHISDILIQVATFCRLAILLKDGWWWWEEGEGGGGGAQKGEWENCTMTPVDISFPIFENSAGNSIHRSVVLPEIPTERNADSVIFQGSGEVGGGGGSIKKRQENRMKCWNNAIKASEGITKRVTQPTDSLSGVSLLETLINNWRGFLILVANFCSLGAEGLPCHQKPLLLRRLPSDYFWQIKQTNLFRFFNAAILFSLSLPLPVSLCLKEKSKQHENGNIDFEEEKSSYS